MINQPLYLSDPSSSLLTLRHPRLCFPLKLPFLQIVFRNSVAESFLVGSSGSKPPDRVLWRHLHLRSIGGSAFPLCIISTDFTFFLVWFRFHSLSFLLSTVNVLNPVFLCSFVIHQGRLQKVRKCVTSNTAVNINLFTRPPINNRT